MTSPLFSNNSVVRNNVSLFGFEIMNLQNRKNKQSVHGTQVNGPYPNKSHSKHTKNRHNGIPEIQLRTESNCFRWFGYMTHQIYTKKGKMKTE